MAYIGKQPVVGNFVKLDAITTSATATYNLLNGGVAYFPQSANNCIVSLNGVIQSPNTSFTISGSTIVFASALTSSDVIDFILVLGDVLNIGTPSDSTVGFSKITSNLITGATAETSIAGGDSILIYDDSATALRKMTRTNFFTAEPAFNVWKNTSQTITTNTDTKITFSDEEFDTNNNFASSTFTPTVAGYYQINASANISNDTVTFERATIYIYKNGSHYKRASWHGSSGSTPINDVTLCISTVVFMNGTTDYLEVYARETGGGTCVVVGNADKRTSFSGCFLRIT